MQTDPELDGIETGPGKPKKVSKRKVKDLQNLLDEAVQWFEQTYPAKFDDEKFLDGDMRNKRAAQETFAANFAEGRGAAMVDAGQHAEIAGALDGIFRATNILSPFEVKAVHKALVKGDESATKVLGLTLAFVATRITRRSRRWPKRSASCRPTAARSTPGRSSRCCRSSPIRKSSCR